MTGTRIFLLVVLSMVGMAYFGYGKKQGALPALLAGMALLVVPYFIHATWALSLVGLALCALPFIWKE